MEVDNRTWETFVAIFNIVTDNPERIIHVWFGFIYEVSQSTIEAKFPLYAIFQSHELVADTAMLYT